MREDYFVNIAFTEGIKLYLSSKNNPDSITYNSFLVVIIRVLALIYGEPDILNPYYLNNKVAFLNNLARYGMNKSDVALFKDEVLNYYEYEIKNNSETVKVVNPYFESILKYLIDMFALKKKNASISFVEEENFLKLIYTTHTTNSYMLSYSYLMNNDVNFLEKYYYSKINELDVTKELNETISMNLNLEALNYVGVNLSNINNLNEKELANANNAAYKYFNVDASKVSRDVDLNSKLKGVKNNKLSLSTGNGYVDILLLMSVIVTSLSVVAIFAFTVF